MYFIITLLIVILFILLHRNKNTIYDSYLGRSLLATLIVLITYCNVWLGIIAVVIAIAMFSYKESFVNVSQLFDQQNHLQKHVYYVPKQKFAPIPQNDTDYIPLNPMQSKAGAIQPSQPARVTSDANKMKKTGNSYQHLLRVEEMVRPKSSKSMNYQTGLNKDYEPKSNWSDENAFKNPYSAAEN